MATTAIFGVNKKDRWNKVGVLFERYPQLMNQLCEAVGECDESFVFDTLTVRGLMEMCAGQIPSEVKAMFRGKNLGQVARIVNSLRRGMEDFARFLENTVPPDSENSAMMRRGMLPSNIEEAILWTLKEAYTLNGLEAAQSLTVYEYKIARKQVYNDAVAARNQSEIARKEARK